MTDWAQERRREKKRMVSNLCMEERKKKYTWDGPAERSMLMTRTRRCVCVCGETLFSFKEILFLCVAAAVASSRERERRGYTHTESDGRTDGREGERKPAQLSQVSHGL
jgi:hypothetical protein